LDLRSLFRIQLKGFQSDGILSAVWINRRRQATLT